MIKQGETENFYFTETDQVGSIISLLNSDGSYAEKYLYDPWGRRRNADTWSYDSIPTSTLIDRGFTGLEHLDEFGLINMNGRMYDPYIGRFLSVDPFIQFPGNSQSFNGYSYCLNNPLKYSDPSGMLVKMRDENDALAEAYFAHMFDVTGAWHYPDMGGGGGYCGGHYGTMGSGFYDTGHSNYNSSDVLGSLWNATPEDGKFHTYTNIYGDWYHTSRSTINYSYTIYTLTASALNVGSGSGDPPGDGPGWEAIKMLWNLKIIGSSVPDNISVDLTLGTVFGYGKSMTFSINLLTRGDAGFYLTRTEQSRIGGEVDWGFNANIGYFTGNPLDINKSSLLGPVRSVSGGWIYGGNISAGYSNSNFGIPSWINVGTGVGLTGGGSYGWGKTYKGWLDY